MKKLFIILFLLFCANAGFAACENIKCPAPYDLTSGTSRFFSTVTGQNYLAEKIGAGLIKKAVKKNITSGNIKAKLDSYSVRDLKAGRFKSIEITGKDVSASGVYISSFSLKTLCDFNYIVEDKNKNIIIKENIPMAFSAVMTEDDINKTMNFQDYQRLLKDINRLSGGLFEVSSTSIKLKNNKLYYTIKYCIPFVRKPKEIVISADLHVENGKIIFTNTNLAGGNSALDIDKISKLLNYINPLDFSAKILENKDARFNIQNVNINDNKITIDGNITILKDKE